MMRCLLVAIELQTRGDCILSYGNNETICIKGRLLTNILDIKGRQAMS